MGKERAEGGREMEKGGNGWDGVVEGTERRAERRGGGQRSDEAMDGKPATPAPKLRRPAPRIHHVVGRLRS